MVACDDSTHRIGLSALFLPDLVLAATHHIQTLPPWLDRLFNWGEGGDAVAVMFATVCIVWAAFLFHSARAPLTHRLFLDFNLTANSTHMGAMLLMALVMPEHREHAAGVIVLGLITNRARSGMLVTRPAGRDGGLIDSDFSLADLQPTELPADVAGLLNGARSGLFRTGFVLVLLGHMVDRL